MFQPTSIQTIIKRATLFPDGASCIIRMKSQNALIILRLTAEMSFPDDHLPVLDGDSLLIVWFRCAVEIVGPAVVRNQVLCCTDA